MMRWVENHLPHLRLTGGEKWGQVGENTLKSCKPCLPYATRAIPTELFSEISYGNLYSVGTPLSTQQKSLRAFFFLLGRLAC